MMHKLYYMIVNSAAKVQQKMHMCKKVRLKSVIFYKKSAKKV